MIDRLIGLICALLGAGAIWHAQTLHVPFAADPVGDLLVVADAARPLPGLDFGGPG